MMAAAIVTATEPYLLSKNSWQNNGKTTAKSSVLQATGFHLDRTSVNTDRDWFDRNRSD